MTDPVSMHLKELDDWEARGLQAMVDLQVGAERRPVSVEGAGTGVGNVAASDGCLRSAEMIDEIMAMGGWHTFHEQSDWRGEYLREKN